MVTPYKEGIYSDLEGLTLPQKVFINNFSFLRHVNLSLTASPFMRRVVKKLGSLEAYRNLPLFTQDPRPYVGGTHYPENIFNEEMSTPIMRFTDQYRREFILIRSHLRIPHIPCIFFSNFYTNRL